MSGKIVAAVITAGAGFAVWVAIALTSGGGVREAWDTPAYFSLGIPLFALAAALAGYLAPERVWRWALAVAAGQAVGMLLVHPAGTGLGLLPLTVIVVGAPLVVVLTIAALIGGVIARRGWASGLLA